jgi:hypothetical protein
MEYEKCTRLISVSLIIVGMTDQNPELGPGQPQKFCSSCLILTADFKGLTNQIFLQLFDTYALGRELKVPASTLAVRSGTQK